MAEWCQKCGTYHDVTTAGGCPDKEDKLWVGTYAEGFRAGQEAAERRAAALEKAFIAVRDELVNLQPHIAQLDKAARPFIDAHVDKASRVINAVLVSTKEGE